MGDNCFIYDDGEDSSYLGAWSRECNQSRRPSCQNRGMALLRLRTSKDYRTRQQVQDCKAKGRDDVNSNVEDRGCRSRSGSLVGVGIIDNSVSELEERRGEFLLLH